MNLIQQSILTLLPSKRKQTTGGWVSFNCPVCSHKGHKPDRRQRGGILVVDDGFVFSCFNCNHKAGWQPGKLLSKNTKELFLWLGLTEGELGQLSIEALKEQDGMPSLKRAFSLQLNKVDLPDDCLPVMQWINEGCEEEALVDIVEYITKERGLSLDDYNWHWSPSTGYADRVILPFYNFGTVVGWTGRKITPGKLKYLTHIHTYTHTHTYTQTHTYTYIHTHTTNIHIHTHIQTNINTHIHTYIHTHSHTYTYTHIHIHTHTYTHVHSYTYTYTHNIHTYTHTHIHKYTSIQSYTYIHTHTYIHIHIHTYTYTTYVHMHTYTTI